MADSETQQDTTQQMTSQTPATKQKIQNVSLRAKLLLKEQKLHARRRKRLSSRHRA